MAFRAGANKYGLAPMDINLGTVTADATALNVKEGAPLLLTFGTRHATLAVKILPGLTSGMLALPVGINGVPVVSATDKVSIAGGAA